MDTEQYLTFSFFVFTKDDKKNYGGVVRFKYHHL